MSIATRPVRETVSRPRSSKPETSRITSSATPTKDLADDFIMPSVATIVQKNSPKKSSQDNFGRQNLPQGIDPLTTEVWQCHTIESLNEKTFQLAHVLQHTEGFAVCSQMLYCISLYVRRMQDGHVVDVVDTMHLAQAFDYLQRYQYDNSDYYLCAAQDLMDSCEFVAKGCK